MNAKEEFAVNQILPNCVRTLSQPFEIVPVVASEEVYGKDMSRLVCSGVADPKISLSDPDPRTRILI